jgi:hypothetical protein
MKSKLGQSYLCQIPITKSNTSDTNEEESEVKISDAERKKRGLQLLAPLYKQCIYAWVSKEAAIVACFFFFLYQGTQLTHLLSTAKVILGL